MLGWTCVLSLWPQHAAIYAEDQKTLLGVMAVDMSLARLTDLIRSTRVSDNAVTFLVDAQGGLPVYIRIRRVAIDVQLVIQDAILRSVARPISV